MSAGLFTAARLAEILGHDVRAVRRELEARELAGTIIVAGNAARGYRVDDLPEHFRSCLETIAQNRGFASPATLLSSDGAKWSHPIPVSAIHPDEITRARRRCEALAPWVRSFSAGALPAADIREGASAAYRHALSFDVSAETITNIMRRAIARDAGRGEFSRWELYLPDAPRRVTSAGQPDRSDDFAQLHAYLEQIDPTHPTLEDRAWVWVAMCENMQLLQENGENPRAARRRLIREAFARAPWMSSSRQSMAQSFDEKWRRYCAGDRTLSDLRAEKSGHRRALPLTEEDQHKLIAHGLGGGLSRAWRDLQAAGNLSPDATTAFTREPASKSYVPGRVREALAPKINLVDDIHHGPRQAKLNGAHISRDWSKISVADWYSADDTTFPAYYYETGPDGEARAIRGQLLLQIDCRSARILAFALHSENNYNARVIRGLILTTHDTYGLPRQGFYYEGAMWENSRIVTGGRNATRDEVSGAESEAGLRDLGVRFIHARTPRAKTIERVIGLLQDRSEHELGYCGRMEMTEKFERLQRKLQLARSGKLDFRSFLLHRDEWVQRLADICDEYNNEKQQGRMLGGLSPRAFWDQRFDFDRPLVRLGDAQRYHLANHRRPLKVTRNGVCVQISRERHWFRNEGTGALVGQTVQAYFNVEDLSSIWLRTDDGVIVVPRAIEAPALDASRDELAAAVESCAAHNRPAKTLYAAISSHFPSRGRSHFRANVVTHADLQQSRELHDQQEQIRAAHTVRDDQEKQLARYSRRLGNLPQSDAVSAARKAAAFKLLEDAT